MIIQHTLSWHTQRRGTLDVTREISEQVKKSKLIKGLAHLFLLHTSASLILCENADPEVRTDIETFLSSWIKDGDPRFKHVVEGRDDLSAHLRTLFTHSDLTLPIVNGELFLGTWQGIFLYEHREHSFERNLLLTLMGE